MSMPTMIDIIIPTYSNNKIKWFLIFNFNYFFYYLFSQLKMILTEENIIYGPPIPKYILDSKSNLSQYFIRLLSELDDKTAIVCQFF